MKKVLTNEFYCPQNKFHSFQLTVGNLYFPSTYSVLFLSLSQIKIRSNLDLRFIRKSQKSFKSILILITTKTNNNDNPSILLKCSNSPIFNNFAKLSPNTHILLKSKITLKNLSKIKILPVLSKLRILNNLNKILKK